MTNVKSPVLQLMIDRRETRSLPRQRADGRFLAVVIEGGAMRGVVSGGMVSALEQLGLTNSVDAVYGSSAGAIAGAYFIGQQASYGTTIYYENINNNSFIDLSRMLTGGHAVSLEYLIDDVCVKQKPLDTDAVLKSPIELHVIAASIIKQKAVDIADFSNGDDLRLALKASSRIPFFAGPPIERASDKLLDASLYESIPYRSALTDPRVTDILVLLTRPKGNFRSAPNLIDKYLVIPYLRNISPVIAAHYATRDKDYRQELDELTSLAEVSEEGTAVAVIQLANNDPKVSSLEKSRKALVEGATAGFRSVFNAFGVKAEAIIEIISPYRREL